MGFAMTGTEKKSLFLAVGAAAALWFAKKAIGIKVAGVGKTLDVELRGFVYGWEQQMADGSITTGDRVFQKKDDLEMYLVSRLKKGYDINYTHPLHAIDGWYVVTDEKTEKVVAEIFVKQFMYYA